jgi:hypothetical protein
MNDILPAVFIVAIAALVMAVVLQVGAGRRARATAARDDELRRIAERAVGAQEATEKRLAEITEQLAAMSQRLNSVERVLKDAE